MNTILILSSIAVVNVLSLKLYVDGNLTLYIHPRYIWFTVIMNAMCLLIVAGVLAYTIRHTSFRSLSIKNHRPTVLAVLVVSLAAAGLILPAKPLLSNSVSQRDASPAGYELTCENAPTTAQSSFQEWHRYINACDDPVEYIDKEVELEGFVYKSGGTVESTYDLFLIARFKVSCCAVDAYPMVIASSQTPQTQRINADQWVRINGSIQPKKTSDGIKPIIEIERVQTIAQPDQPYEFINY